MNPFTMTNSRIAKSALLLATAAALIGCSPNAEPAVAPEAPAVAPLKPGKPHATGIGPWYQGWELASRTLCLESTIAGIPTYFVSAELGKAGIVAPVSGVTGGCAARGYKPYERVVLRDMTAAEKVSYGDSCAVTLVRSIYVTDEIAAVDILYNRTGVSKTACGDGDEWRDVAAHEVGHVVGLSHSQAYVSSIMRDGHWYNSTDIALLKTRIYDAKPLRVNW